jgi:hypothetical protein
MTTIVKFPYNASRCLYSRRPRKSKNGTPEERAAKAAIDAAKMVPAEVVELPKVGLGGVCSVASGGSDPIYAVIERHKAACADHDEAVRIEFAFEEVHMQGEKLRQYQNLHAQTADAWERLEDANTDLVTTPPATLAGIASLCRYIEPLLADVDTSYLPDTIAWDDDNESTPAGALANTIAATIEGMLASNPQGGES